MEAPGRSSALTPGLPSVSVFTDTFEGMECLGVVAAQPQVIACLMSVPGWMPVCSALLTGMKPSARQLPTNFYGPGDNDDLASSHALPGF
jgi:hypothetical protein